MSEFAGDGVPVAVSLWVLKLSRQPYYRWRKQQATDAELVEAQGQSEDPAAFPTTRSPRQESSHRLPRPELLHPLFTPNAPWLPSSPGRPAHCLTAPVQPHALQAAQLARTSARKARRSARNQPGTRCSH